MADRKGKAEVEEPAGRAGSHAFIADGVEGLVETAGQKKARETFEALAPSGYARARHPELREALRQAGEIFNGVGSEHQQSIWSAARKARKRATKAATKKYGKAGGSIDASIDATHVAYARAYAQSLEVAEAMSVFAREVPGSYEVFCRVAEGSAQSRILSQVFNAKVEDAPDLPRPMPMMFDPAKAGVMLTEFYQAS